MIENLKVILKNNVFNKNEVFLIENEDNSSFYKTRIQKDKWITYIKSCNKEQLNNEIYEIFNEWERVENQINWKTLNHFYHEYLQIVYYSIKQKGLEVEQVFSSHLVNNREKILTSTQALKTWAILLANVLIEQIQDEEANDTVVDKVKKYVKKNIDNHKLSRENIALHVHFNPDYLVRIFKKETGLSISEYIIQNRIKKAEELLVSSELSISDIALECGYSNFSYFSTLFKRVNGLSPNEYRKNVKSRNN